MGPIRRKLRDRLAERLIEDAVAQGADRAKAEAAVADLTADRPLIDLLLNVDWAKLIEMILKLIALGA